MSSSSGARTKQSLLNELEQLKHQVIDIDSLTQRNAELEEEVERLYLELDEATKGILKRGYLFKWRDREISFASKWGLRYFALQGHNLSYYLDDKDSRPRSTVNLSNCCIKWEGSKKNNQFHVFSLYTGTTSTNVTGSLLMRLSSESLAEAEMWVAVLTQACSVGRQFSRVNSVAGNDLIRVPSLSRDVSRASEDSSSPVNASLALRKNISKQNLKRTPSMRNDSTGDLSSSSHHPAVGAGAGRLSKPAISHKDHPFPASRPIHTINKTSPLSSDVKQGEQNYRGFFNLGLIIMVLTHVRILVDESKKRSLMDLNSTIPSSAPGPGEDALREGLSVDAWFMMAAGAGWAASVFVVYAVEILAYRQLLPKPLILVLNGVILLLNILFPILLVWYTTSNSGLAMLYLLGSVVLWTKLWSYTHVNYDLRKKQFAWLALHPDAPINTSHNPNPNQDGEEDDNAKPIYIDSSYSEVKNLIYPIISYPDNITPSNLLYFIACPTLCYQLNYPKMPYIRWKYVFTYVSRLVVIGFIMIYSVRRFITPTLEHSLQVMEDRNIFGVLERLLKLSLPNTYVWLLGFYWFFHLWLNLLAELTRFGDRLFYKDWWNARTLDIYWRTWNIPVHLWVVRHLYYPIIRRGYSKNVATYAAFLFSAAFHEIIISVPFRHISFHAFLGMIAQAPLIYITKLLDSYLDNSYISNAMFWMIFCIIGQPMGVILYYYDLWKVGQQIAAAAV